MASRNLKQSVVGVLLILLVAGTLAACGGSDGASTTDTGAPAGPATIVEDGGTRTVTHPLGTTEVPADPQRVVALGEEFLLADLLDLGVVPVASTATNGEEFSGIDDPAAADIQILPSAELDLERLVALDPDVIITSVAIAELAGYDRLSSVAPTVAIDGSDWRQSYLDTAAVFGQEAEAEARLAEYDDAVAAAKEQLGAEPPTVSVLTVYPGDALAFWVDGPINVPQVLLDLGVTLVPGPTDVDAKGGRAYVSAEQLDLAQGEVIVALQNATIEGEDASYASVTGGPLWSALPAVQSDEVLVVDRLGYPGLTGRLALVELFGTELA